MKIDFLQGLLSYKTQKTQGRGYSSVTGLPQCESSASPASGLVFA